MLSFVSFILMCVGCLNWFSIGILQYDFVAGIFGSQSNIFSRLIYTLVGVASIIVVANFITNKGTFRVSFKKADKEYNEFKREKEAEKRRTAMATESAEDFSLAKKLKSATEDQEDDSKIHKYTTEADKDKHTTHNKKSDE